VVAAQACLLALLILAIRTEQLLINSFLAAYLLAEAIRLTGYFLLFVDSPEPAWALAIPALGALAAPAIYFYVRALTDADFRPVPTHLVHIVPGILGYLALLWMIALRDGPPQNVDVLAQAETPRLSAAITFVVNVIMAAYALAALKMLRAHRRGIENIFSSVERISLNWLSVVVTVLVLSWAGYAVVDLFRLAEAYTLLERISLNTAITALIIYVISIGGMREQAVFRQSIRQFQQSAASADNDAAAGNAGKANGLEEEDDSGQQGAKYSKSGVDDERVQLLWEKLTKCMELDKPYLEPSLSLLDLSGMLDVSPQVLSQVINSQAGQTFYQYINYLRVESAKHLLSLPTTHGQSMLQIGEDAGFNSQSTFYNHFRKLVGMSPKQYRDQLPDSGTGSAS